MTPAVSFRSVSKRFPGALALDHASFDIGHAACRSIIGEKGAGKSTLGKLLSGIYKPDSGHNELTIIGPRVYSRRDFENAIPPAPACVRSWLNPAQRQDLRGRLA